MDYFLETMEDFIEVFLIVVELFQYDPCGMKLSHCHLFLPVLVFLCICEYSVTACSS